MCSAVTDPVATARLVPFDYATAAGMSEWRRDLAWPISYPTLRGLQTRFTRHENELLAGLGDPAAKRIGLLAAPRIGAIARELGEAALLAFHASRAGHSFAGAQPDLKFLSGAAPIEAAGETRALFPEIRIPRPLLRRIARVASWSRGPGRLAANFLFAEALAVSHNTLLRDAAARGESRVGYRHAELILDAARRRGGDGSVDEAAVEAVLAGYVTAIALVYRLPEDLIARMQQLFRYRAMPVAIAAARDLAALERAPRLPERLWSSTGGHHASRAVSLEVVRRGGEATGFAHGGSIVMVDDADFIALFELVGRGRFVMPTARAAEIMDAQSFRLPDPTQPVPDFVGGTGDPTFRGLAEHGARSQGRRRVLYVTTTLRGMHQNLPTLLPDVVYVDHQLRIAETLQGFAVDLICKPHPEGLLAGQLHPLESVARTEYRRFEDVMNEADIFVFDYAQSTTFWEAMCSDRPVVLIDLGISRFNAPVGPLVAERCRTVPARWDADNRPSVDHERLREAVCGGSDRADGAPFRAILAGE
jgi:hypothetical protein